MDVFLLVPAFQKIYGRPMAVIHDRVLMRPAEAGIIGFLITLPILVVGAIEIFLGMDSGLLLLLMSGLHFLMAPLAYALYRVHKKLDELSETELMVLRYELKQRRPNSKQSSVILNKD